MIKPLLSKLKIGPRGNDERFSKAAVDYVDSLLDAQAALFNAQASQPDENIAATTLPPTLDYSVEEDAFLGGGWSHLVTENGLPARWMRRVGAVLIRLDMSAPRTVTVQGAAYGKRGFLQETSVWIDDMPVNGEVTSSGNHWAFSGEILATDNQQPYAILRIKAPSMVAKEKDPFSHVSLAVSRIQIS